MKTSKNILAKATLGLALLASAFQLSARDVHAEEIPEEQTPIVRLGLDFDSSTSLGYKVGVPGRCVPRYPDNIYRDHQTVGSGSIISSGPRIQLFSLLEASVKYNLASLGEEENSFTTYWGGYGIGEFAGIGAVRTRKEPLSYDLTIQTPLLVYFKSQDYGLRAFVSYVRNDFDMFYQSGYHKFGKEFYEVEDHFKIGDFEAEGLRYGIKALSTIRQTEISVKIFYQNNSIKGKATEEGKDFRWDNKDHLLGFGIEVMF